MVWKIARAWQDQTAFIIGGGPSLKNENVESLRGRNVIAVNSAYEAVPFAPYLFFADSRWYEVHRDKLASFPGRIVTVSQRFPEARHLLRLSRRVPNTNPKGGPLGPGLAPEPTAVAVNRTSLQGAMNMAYHLGVNRIVLCGADMGRDPVTGETHHHSPHPWKNKPGNLTWDIQMEQLGLIVAPLRERGIAVINTSMHSRIPDSWGWPKVPLSETLK
jgi:hypothetical protein